MKRILSCIVISATMVTACTSPQRTADYRTVPLPQEILLNDNGAFVLEDGQKIVCPSGNADLRRNACFLAEYVEETTGICLETADSVLGTAAIVLSTELDDPDPEAYEISVSDSGAVISGASGAGVFYGIQTFRKSLPVMKRGTVLLPAAIIRDRPRFAYRGMMLDVCRHFFSVEEVKQYIDMLALHHINRFHWHLTEDQGWRIEIREYPRLTETGSMRKQTMVGKNFDQFDGIPHGGFFTQEEAREIVRYAAERYITVIPEIDMPGHMQAALASYPELGCTGGPYEVRQTWGVSSDVLCAGKPQTLQFVKEVLAEVMEIFPSSYIHIGGDECAKDNWEKCEACQSAIARLGLVSDAEHTCEQRLQSWFMSEVEAFLREHGRTMIGWDEILEGGAAEEAVVMAWRGIDKGVQAARLGHDVIMTPSSHLYFDHYQSMDKGEPLAIGGYSPVSHVYGYEPYPSDLDEDLCRHIKGVQANLWTEYIPDFRKAQYMVLPRMDALSEVQWTLPENKDYEDFCRRLTHMFQLYRLYGWNYAEHVLEVTADTDLDPKAGVLSVSLHAAGNSEIRYTLDGSKPGRKSLLYTGPFEVKENCRLKARAMHPSGVSPVLEEELVAKTDLEEAVLLQPPHESYGYKGAVTLIDGKKGGTNYRTGRWLGFCGNDPEAVLRLREPGNISSVSFNACVVTQDWVFDARGMEVEVSEDGEAFRKVASESYPAMEKAQPPYLSTHKLTFAPVHAEYVKVRILTEHEIPEWHGGAGSPGFVFVDEISID